MSSKGKTFRSSPLCSQQAVDSFSENDEEVEEIFSQSQRVSRKRSAEAEEEDGCVENERRETSVSSGPSAEPANVDGWTPAQVKTWICSFFDESVGQIFVEEEIDGKALLSKRLEEDSTLEKLGVTTIGKKERFLRELMAIKPTVNDNSRPFVSGPKRKKIDRSSFKDFDRLLTREEREHLSCKEKSIYNTKKKKITKEVERRWPRSSVLPVYRNKTDAVQVDTFAEKMVKDGANLYQECGFGKEAVLETVLKKIREQRRQQKEKPLTRDEVLSTDSASESTSTESVESSSGSPSPPTYSSQLQRVKAYNLYFDEDMPHTTAELIVMVALGKTSIKEVKMEQLQKMKKIFNLGLLRGKDKMTHIRAIANSLCSEGYIQVIQDEDQESVNRNDVKKVKEIILKDL